MNQTALRIYHHLPASLRSVAATVRGVQLRFWRYGPESEVLVEEALERERWSPAQWKAWQEERLTFILDRAARRVPFYRDLWSARRQKGDRASWHYLENWPVLEKESVRRDAQAFVADDCDTRKMFPEHTSGTTGTPLSLWWSRQTVRAWYALFEARCRRWYGVSRYDRWAILGGQLVTRTNQSKPPFWVWNWALNQLYLSSYHLAPELIPYYLDALKNYRVRYLWGYSSSLYALAQEALRLGRQDLKIELAITNAEPLYNHQRATIEQAFQCPCRETYGMSEIVAAASECNHRRLHLWPEVGLVEDLPPFLNENGCAADNLVCTGLLNPDMPLIRYLVGDRGHLALMENDCPCGRSLPCLQELDGRDADTLYTIEGRRLSSNAVDTIFSMDVPLIEGQIVQETFERVRIRYVPASEFTDDHLRQLVNGIQERMGSVEVLTEKLSKVPRCPNGKYRVVVSELPTIHRTGH